ncbi:DNA primase [Corynebacterium caspium]|uniref:DNA primase n=1 Tax=Corynebacterium caspium TaxID=234828 RepID=UPI0003704453|nr:DNA primase [Corynebacterium caspium]WKD58911.1 DNA primase [Corynebacterium caspium DSM 44850]
MAKGRIPESDIQAIRERTPIEEVVGEYVQLKPAGVDSLKGLSPFKDERTPSFHVRPSRGYYHCFSTGQGGDVFSFLMEMEHLSFPEAVEACAEKIGYRINYEGGGSARRVEPGTRQRLIAANRAAHAFYREQLETPEAEIARNFLLERGFSQAHIYQFECGYSPLEWDAMTKTLLRKGFEFKDLEAAGLSTMGRRGPIDRFRGRLLWPIKNMAGDVIGFGARKLYESDNLGKYMNTPDTMLYHKSKVLFGLSEAKRDIANQHQAVVVEGYTDVMAMHAAGIHTAVAACGTAFGEEHLQILRRLMLDDNYFRGELIYTFDGDEAGQKAALKAFESDQKFTGQSYVAIVPDGLDPCDLRLEKGDAAVRDLIASREPIFEFALRSALAKYPLDSVEGRLQALRRTVPIVAGIRDEALRSQYARLLAGWVGWPDPDQVLQDVIKAARAPRKLGTRRQAKRFANVPVNANAPVPTPLPDPRLPSLWPQREALKLALQYPELAGSYFDNIATDAFTNTAYRMLRDGMQAAGGCANAAPGVQWITSVADQMPDLGMRELVSQLAVEEMHIEDHEVEAYIDAVFSRLQESYIGNEIAQLKGKLERMRPSDDEITYNALFADLVALEQARRELKQRVFRPPANTY